MSFTMKCSNCSSVLGQDDCLLTLIPLWIVTVSVALVPTETMVTEAMSQDSINTIGLIISVTFPNCRALMGLETLIYKV